MTLLYMAVNHSCYTGRFVSVQDGCVGVYGEQEQRFVFKSVVVGQTSKARFKISNPHKVVSLYHRIHVKIDR